MKLLSLFFVNISYVLVCAQPYVMAYFSKKPGLNLAYSMDAENWVEIKSSRPFFMPDRENSNNCFRDPYVYQGPDGIFHMVWTTGHSDSFGYSSSVDLIHWTPQRRIRIMRDVKTTKNVWAPKIIYDEKCELFYVLWSSTVGDLMTPEGKKNNDRGWDHRIYCATTKDFVTFSKPWLYYDPGFTVIDAAMVKIRRRYALILKDERRIPEEKNIKVAFFKNIPEKIVAELSSPITDNKEAWAEGPAPLKVGKYTYVYYDKYCQGRTGVLRTRRGKRWEDISERCSFPKYMRHGSALSVDKKILNGILDASR